MYSSSCKSSNQCSRQEILFFCSETENVATFDDDASKILQYNLTILNTHKQITEKLCVIVVANEFAALNENRKSNFCTFKLKNRT